MAEPERDSLPFLHLLPNLITILALCAGLTSMRFGFEGRVEPAAVLIIAAAVLPAVDGLVARRLNAASRFGAELDSLSDFVSFGVAPAMLVFQFALSEARGIGWIFVLAYVVCCGLRLARFNVTQDEVKPGMRVRFVGVPAPAGALMALLPVFLAEAGIADMSQFPVGVALYLGLIGFLMVSRLPTFSPKSLRVSREKSRWILIGTAIAVGMMFTRFWLLFVLFDALYAASLVYSAVSTRIRSQK